jgi:hypothetical protein
MGKIYRKVSMMKPPRESFTPLEAFSFMGVIPYEHEGL